MGFGGDTQYSDVFQAIFPVQLTAFVESGGVYYYTWLEQTFNTTTGALAVAIQPRKGTATNGPFMAEINNSPVSVPSYAWARLRGIANGIPFYEFFTGNQGLSVQDNYVYQHNYADVSTLQVNVENGLTLWGQVYSLQIGTNTGGTFTITVSNYVGTYTTPSQAYNVTASALQTAITALTNVGTGNVQVTAFNTSSGWQISFNSTMGIFDSPITVTGNLSGLTGGSGASLTETNIAIIDKQPFVVEDNASSTPNVYTGINELQIKTGAGSTTNVKGLTLTDSGNLAIIGIDNFSILGVNNTASGSYAIGIGWGNSATGNNSTALGYHNTTALLSTAVGYTNLASGAYASAIGYQNTASGHQFSVAIGGGNTASGYGNAVAMGYGNTASGAQTAVAIGYSNNAAAVGAVAMGVGCGVASGANQSVAMGWDCQCYSTGSSYTYGCFAAGIISSAQGGEASSVGCACVANALHAVAVGYSNEALAVNSVAIGNDCYSNSTLGIAIGYQVTCSGTYRTEIGYGGNKIAMSASGIIPVGSPAWCSTDASPGITTTMTTATGVGTFKNGLLTAYTGS